MISFRRAPGALLKQSPDPQPPSTGIVELRIDGAHVRIIGRRHFLVKSRTERDVWHCVDLEVDEDRDDPEPMGCYCREYHHRSRDASMCWHLELVLEIMKDRVEFS